MMVWNAFAFLFGFVTGGYLSWVVFCRIKKVEDAEYRCDGAPY